MAKSCSSCFCWALSLLLIFSSLLCAATDDCQSESSCILPDPQSSLEPGNLDDIWLETTCMLGCVQKYDKTSEILNTDTAWPTMNFTKYDVECISFQKIRECTEGCVMRHNYPHTTINRCRDLCYSACESSPPPCIEGDDCDESHCSRSCRKTYCRFGCEVYDETRYSARSDSALKHPPSPSMAPNVSQEMPASKWQSWLHTTNYESAAAVATRNSVSHRKLYATSAYLVRLNTSSQTYYIWHKDINKPLDLSPFACSKLSISFAMISKYRRESADDIQFSPSTTVCSMGVGGYPSNVSNIQATYTEDSRENFVGYSVARVTWTAPEDSTYLTSYTIRVYPYQLRCGGTKDVVYSFVNIDKTLTNFTFQAETNIGLWKFGCSYIIEVISLPSRNPIGKTIGSYITSATELATQSPPLILKCGRVWNEDGNFNISVEWEFPESLSFSHITRYVLTPSLESRLNGPLQSYNYTAVTSDRNSYYVLTQMFVPQTTPNLTLVIEMNVEKNHMYYWRTIPRAESCSVPTSPVPPSPVEAITISQLSYNMTTKELRTVIHISPPANWHGLAEEYELVVSNSRETCKSCAISQGLHFWSKTTTFEITTSIDVSNASNCLYFLARASNHYNLSSDWLEEIAPLNSNCDTNPTTKTSVLSIVYKREDGTSSSVLNLGYPILPSSNRDSAVQPSSKLQAIDFKLQDFTLRIQEDSEGSHVKLLSHSHLKLASIEEKINAVIAILGQQSQT